MKTLRRGTRRPYRSRLWLQALETRTVPATTIVVNSTADGGAGSLRQALLDANTGIAPYDGVDTIQFNFGGPATVSLTSAITVTEGVEIQGGGTVTVKQTGLDRILLFNNGVSGQSTFTLSGLTFTGGNDTGTTAGDRGGAIAISDEYLIMQNCVVTGNTAAAGGGGLAVLAGGVGGYMALTGCSITNNVVSGSGNDGGGIRGTTNAGFNLTDCIVTGNTSADDGGGLYFYKAAATTVTNTTIAHNRAAGTDASGGGVSLGNVATNTISFINCTIANNSAFENGGGFRLSSTFTTAGAGLVFDFCTIADNVAQINGGGLFRDGLGSGVTINLNSSVVAHNSSAASPDFFATSFTALNVANSAISTLEGYQISSGSLAFAADTPLRLGVLANNGGPVPTMLPASGSPLVNAGGTASTFTDARGNPRVDGIAADIGAAETVGGGIEPVAVRASALPVVEKPGDGRFTITMTYYDAAAVKFASIAAGNVTVSGPTAATVSLGSVVPGADAGVITAEYVVTPVGGTWDSSENGTYTMTLANNVENTGGAKIPGATLGSFGVAVGSVFTVTTDAPSGAGSLLDALTLAQAGTAGLTDLIEFDPAFFSVPRTVTLGAALAVNDSLFIQGPGRDLLTIRQAGTDRLFLINDALTTKLQQRIPCGHDAPRRQARVGRGRRDPDDHGDRHPPRCPRHCQSGRDRRRRGFGLD